MLEKTPYKKLVFTVILCVVQKHPSSLPWENQVAQYLKLKYGPQEGKLTYAKALSLQQTKTKNIISAHFISIPLFVPFMCLIDSKRMKHSLMSS